MVAAFFNDLFKILDGYRENIKLANDPKTIHDLKERYAAVSEVVDILHNAWDRGESMRTEAFEVMPATTEDVLILRIKGLRVFKDENDGHIFYEMERRHLDTEKEVLQRIIDEYNCKYDRRRKAGPGSWAFAAGYSDLNPITHELDWKRQKDGSYKRKPLPVVKE